MSEEPSSERWLVSFADFMTLLFALFAVLYATSTQDLEKTKKFQDSIKRYLIKAGVVGGSGEGGEKAVSSEKLASPIEPPIQTYNPANPLSNETFDEAEKFVEERLSQSEQKKYVLDVQRDALGVKITLAASALFTENSEKFKAEALPFLERLGDLLQRVGRKVMLEGHLNPGEYKTNHFASDWELSGARTTSMVRYLIKRYKMDPTLFIPVAYGSSRPLTDGRKDNDRLEVVIMTEDIPL